MNFRTKTPFYFLCLFLLLSTRVYSDHLFDISLEDLLSIPINGPTLTDTNLIDAPASVTLFTHHEIQSMPVSNIEELMNYVVSIQAYRTTDISNHLPFSIRGKRSGSSTVDVLILINGARIDNPYSGGVTIPYPSIPLQHIERIEIIRGPGSSLYGSNAYMGVINIITDTTRSRIFSEAGSDDHYVVGALDQFQNEALKGNVFIETKKDNGQSYQVVDQFGSGLRDTQDAYSQIDGMLNVTLLENTRLQFLANQRKVDGFYVLGSVDDDINQWQSHHYNLLLEHKFHLTEAIKSTLQGGHNRSGFDSTFRPVTSVPVGTISTPSSDAPLLLNPAMKSRGYWARWFNQWQLENDRSIQFGLEYQRNSVRKVTITSNYNFQQLLHNELPIDYYGGLTHPINTGTTKDSENIYGAFIQYQDSLTRTLQFIAGLRYDDYSYTQEQFSPRLGLVYQATPTDTLKLLYGHAFRAPKYSELYNVNNGVIIGNENLEAESVDTVEAIWIKQWHDSLFMLNLYYNDFKNPIIQELNGNARSLTNGPDHFSSGAELEINWAAMDSLKIRSTLSTLFSQPQRDREESENLFSIIVNYRVFPWTFNLASFYNDTKRTYYEGETQQYDDYWIANLKIIRSFHTGFTPYIDLRNIGNSRYTTPASFSSAEQGAPNRSREIRLGFVFDY